MKFEKLAKSRMSIIREKLGMESYVKSDVIFT